MRNLLLFITRYHYFFLFILLEFVSLFLLIRDNYYQHASFMNTSGKVTGLIHEGFSGITEYFRLSEINDQLLKENALLKGQLRSSYFQYLTDPDTIVDTIYKQKYEFVIAKVVNSTTHKQNNYFTLNKGKSHGVKPGMGVICGEGVTGIVREVSDNFSTVMSVLHQKVLIPSMVKKYQEPGILHWDGKDHRYAYLPNIPRHLKLQKGDTIVTSSSSAIFPEGTLIGTIDKIDNVQGNTFVDLRVLLSSDLKKLSYAYVVVYLFKDEQDELETRTQNDK